MQIYGGIKRRKIFQSRGCFSRVPFRFVAMGREKTRYREPDDAYRMFTFLPHIRAEGSESRTGTRRERSRGDGTFPDLESAEVLGRENTAEL